MTPCRYLQFAVAPFTFPYGEETDESLNLELFSSVRRPPVETGPGYFLPPPLVITLVLNVQRRAPEESALLAIDSVDTRALVVGSTRAPADAEEGKLLPRTLGGRTVVKGFVQVRDAQGAGGYEVRFIPVNLTLPDSAQAGSQFQATITIAEGCGSGSAPAFEEVLLIFENDQAQPIAVEGDGPHDVPTSGNKSLTVTLRAPQGTSSLFGRATTFVCAGEAVDSMNITQ